MINYEIVFSVLAGGMLSMLGSLLAHHLQNRLEQSRLRRELKRDRLTEVRRYVSITLQFVDLVAVPTVIGLKNFGDNTFEEWASAIEEQLEDWKSLPVKGSARVLFVKDEDLLDKLKQIDRFRARFYFNYLNMVERGEMQDFEEEREELKQVAKMASKRVDELLEDI